MGFPIKHGLSHTPEYNRFAQAKARCQNPKNARYKDYGGRGIEFRFSGFEEFWNHLGPAPVNTSLDRINNDGHYEVGNVRWATWAEQWKTRRPNTGKLGPLSEEHRERLRVVGRELSKNPAYRQRLRNQALEYWRAKKAS